MLEFNGFTKSIAEWKSQFIKDLTSKCGEAYSDDEIEVLACDELSYLIEMGKMVRKA